MHEKPLTLAASPRAYLERMDSRIKLACLLVWVVCVVSVSARWSALYGLYGAILLVLVVSHPGVVAKFFRRFASAMPFVLVFAAVLPFLKPGRVLWALGPFEITEPGLLTALHVAAAATLCVGAMSLVWASTSEGALLAGLRGVGLPATLVSVLGFMLRYLHVLRPELHRLTDARAGRTIGPHGPGMLRSGANVLGSLFLRAHDRADRVGDAMVARCFDGQPRLLLHFHWHVDELVAGAVFVAVIVVLRVVMVGQAWSTLA